MTENIFKNIVELSPFPVYVTTGEDLIITVANDATLKAWGRDKSVLGKKFEDALPELKNQPFASLIRQVMRTGEPYYTNSDRADIMVDGVLQTFFYKFSYQPMPDEGGLNSSVLCFASNVTVQEEALIAAARSRQTLENMVRQAPVGICILSVEKLLVEIVNESYLQLVGRSREELEGRSIWDTIPEAAESYRPVMDSVIQTGRTFYAKEHLVMLVRNGVEEDVYIDFVYEPVVDMDGQVDSVLVIAIDVTDKVEARRAIEEAEQRARLAIEATEMGTFDVDLLNDQIRTSQRFDQIFDTEKDAPKEVHVSRIHPDDMDIRNAAHDEAARTGILAYEARLIRRDGTVRWIRVQARTYLSQEGRPKRILGTVLDITEYKRLQQQKDDFISVASHELKTPMTSIKASMQVLGRIIKSDPASEKVPEFMGKVNTNLAKMQQLVESLLNVSKISSGQLGLQKSHFVMAAMINDCCDHIRMDGIYELITTGDTTVSVFADKYKIDQVVVNLVNNAVKYAPESKRILIDISKPDAQTVKVSVSDSGPGIPASKLTHIFDRYYRVDASGLQYSGLGLGLYISADIVARHGGQIGVDSKEGEGSTFWFTLPLSD